jgi:hypothetical protein
MITFFSTPKAFEGHIGIIQRNAIRSWMAIKPQPEIILLGDEKGIAEIAEEYNLHHIANIKTQDNTPLLDDIFIKAKNSASNDYLCFINTDIIIVDDFMEGFYKVKGRFDKFLMINSRWNLEITDLINVELPEIRESLRKQAIEKHDVHVSGGTDIFLFPRWLYNTIPPLLLGRGYWDNWLMYQAKKNGAVLVDTTGEIITIHQNHDYSHIKGIEKGDRSTKQIWKGQDGLHNLKLSGGKKAIYTAYDADYILDKGRFRSTLEISLIYRRIKATLRRIKHQIKIWS